MKSFPKTPFPSGWYRIAYSQDLPPRKVLPLRYFGQDLVLYRADNGTPHLLDAHCPHLGAHLGHGGTVDGDNLRCPFHAWAFEPTGICSNIPYTKRIPAQARLRSWPLYESQGLIATYYHPQGQAPSWHLPNRFPWLDDNWSTASRSRRWEVHSHIQEIDENNMDVAHMLPVHKALICDLKDYPLEIDGPVLTHRMFARVDRALVLGKRIKVSFEAEFKFYGLGFHCTYTQTQAGLGESLTLAMLTPIDAETVELQTIAWTKKFRFNPLATWLVRSYMHNLYNAAVEQDYPIWEHKVHRSTPLLCEGDGQIMPYRRWANQFYPKQENSNVEAEPAQAVGLPVTQSV